MNGPLQGVRVLDLTRVLAGPFCTMQLADMGAEVIKIERPGVGDDSNIYGPFKNGQSSYFMYLNRGKKSIELNFKNPEAVIIFKKLVEKSDVVVENFKPGVVDKLGIGYRELKEVNPKIVYASISGFGQYGPYREKPAYDLVAQAMGGLMSITGFPENPPTRVGSSIGDVSAGLYAAFGIMLALYNREKTGKGQYVDVAMMDSVFSFCESNIVRYTIGNILPTRVGSRHPLSAPFDLYKAKDGYVVIAVANETLMDKLCHVMDKPELHVDPRFETDAKRSENAQELKTIIEQWLGNYTVKEAVQILLENSIPSSEVLNIAEVCNDPQVAAREMLIEIEHPIAGKIKIPGNPVKLSETPCEIKKPAPLLGQHNEEVLKELLGYDEAYIKKLKEEHVI